MSTKIGVYSGAFDPVHAGHVAFAREAMQRCGLSEVVFLPEREPRGKSDVTDISHRLALLEHAVGDVAGMRPLVLQTAQFTVHETLPELERLFAGAELYMLIGSDVVRTFSYRWEGLDVFLARMPLVIALRQGDSAVEVEHMLAAAGAACRVSPRFTVIDVPHPALASTLVRAGQVAPAALHPRVEEYIAKNRLYGATRTRE